MDPVENQAKDPKRVSAHPAQGIADVDRSKLDAPPPAKKAAISGLNDIGHRSTDRQFTIPNKTSLFFDPDAKPPMHSGEPGIPKYFRRTLPPSSLSSASASEGAPPSDKEGAVTGLNDTSRVSLDGQEKECLQKTENTRSEKTLLNKENEVNLTENAASSVDPSETEQLPENLRVSDSEDDDIQLVYQINYVTLDDTQDSDED